MIVEFTRRGKTYQLTVPGAPAPTIKIPFRPCPLKPPGELELSWVATDELRAIELYKPIQGAIA